MTCGSGAWAVIHHLPGRLRAPVPGLLGNRALAARLEARLYDLAGIRGVQANPDSGRVLVLYDPRRLSLAVLGRALGFGIPAVPAPVPPVAAAANRVTVASREAAAALEVPVAALAGPEGGLGLTTAEASHRLERYGPNTLEQAPQPSFWQRFVHELKGAMVLTLLGGAGLALLAGRLRDALTIAAILCLNAAVGASQSARAAGSLAALRRMEAPQATVWRDGGPVVVPAAAVVPGDVLLLQAGDKVAADALILQAVAAEAEESMLTGESLAVQKMPAAADAPPGDGCGRSDMVFAGTTITRGHLTARVTTTGMSTEMGRIAALLGHTTEAPTPLQERMDELGRLLVKGVLLVCGGVVAVGLLRGQPLVEMFLSGVGLAVAAIPEGLPTFVTLGLATGVRQMARRRALVRRLQAVEALGSATVICSDKTGTLTSNQMTVRQIFAGARWYDVTGTGYDLRGEFRRRPTGALPRHGGGRVDPLREPDLSRLLRVGLLCNNAALEQGPDGWRVVGDATEGALLVAAAKAGLPVTRSERKHRRTNEVPFDSARRRMTVVCDGPRGPCIYSKGAPEAVLAICTHLAEGRKRRPLTAAGQQQILAAADAMAGRAYRVLAVAYRPLPDDLSADPEQGLIFVGLLGLMDAPRPEVRGAIARCRRAGIRVVMLTGDHPRTAAAVAQEIGLLEPGGWVATGEELSRLDDRQLAERVERLQVCARVCAEEKLRVVRALHSRGHVVVMTGDGVNDAPAVKEADIGVAMGRSGTEVTKEAASLVLADDNFATIVAAVEQGRVTYNNIRRSIRYLLASNVGELVVMSGAVFLGLPLPLMALQLLWLNLVGDGLPALSLGAEPAGGDEMEASPRPRRESLFAGGLGAQIVRHGVKMGLAGLGLFLWAMWRGKPLAVVRTLTLCTLLLGQFLYVVRCRGGTRRCAVRRRRANPTVRWAVAASLALLVASVHWAPLRRLLQFAPLSTGEWAAAGLAAVVGAA